MGKLKHNRSWYTKKLVAKAKACVKQRDKYTCQYCGKEVEGSNCHASHILNVGTHKNMELDPSNMKVLCYHHHMNWWHKDILHATKWFQEKFPVRYEYVMRMSKLDFKITTVQMAELHEATKADGSDYGETYYKLIQEIIT